MSLILVLFIIIVLTLKNTSDKAKSEYYGKITNSEIQTRNYNKKRFISKYEDRALEDSIMSDENEVNEMREAIIREVGIEDPSDRMILLSVMAKHGKIPHKYVYNGILNKVYFGDKLLAKNYTMAQELMVKQFWFLKWYNNLLITHGMEDDELYYYDYRKYTKAPLSRWNEGAIRLTRMSAPPEMGGFYCWRGVEPIFEATSNIF